MRAHHVETIALGLSLPIGLIGLWAVLSARGALPPQILPSPTLIFRGVSDLIDDGSLVQHLQVSLKRVAFGFGGGAVFGLLVGAATGLSDKFRGYIQPIINVISQVNAMAWMPLLVLFLGIDELLKYVVIGWSASVPIALGTARGIGGVPEKYLDLARALDFSAWDRWALVVWPSVLPSVFTGLKEGLANAWQALVIAELFASYEGIGYLMAWGRQLFQLELVIVGMITIALVGFALTSAMTWVENILLVPSQRGRI